MSQRSLNYCDLGVIDYQEAWDLQKETLNLRVEQKVNDTLFLLEHPHTYTLGKVADKKNLIGSEDFLSENKISVFDIDRGGDITYHGPGQIVGYPIIDLKNWKQDTHKYLRALEEVIIKTCADYGLEGIRDSRYTGVWVGDKKIAAIGIKVSRWVTMHGFAFNVNTDLGFFSGIIPCGITDKGVTSLKNELRKTMHVSEVKEKLKNNLKEIFDYDRVMNITRDELIPVTVPYL